MTEHEQVVLVLLDALAGSPLGVEGIAGHFGTVGGEKLAGGASEAAGQVQDGAEDVEGQESDTSQRGVGHAVILALVGSRTHAAIMLAGNVWFGPAFHCLVVRW